MSFADAIAVNSNFTKGVVARTWPALAERRDFKVVYPAIDTEGDKKSDTEQDGPMWKDKQVILSINRFERKKDVGLAIRAYAGLPEEKRKGVRLVIAGSFFSLPPLRHVRLILTLLRKAATTTAYQKTYPITAT